MTNPTLERAARAAAKADATLHNGPDLYDANPELYLRLTRAVLMAVRAEGMNIYHSSDLNSPFPDYSAAEGFGDMIDAILNDGEGE